MDETGELISHRCERTIPVYIMEEHHEAFYYWNYFVKNGLMCPKGNYLLHLDHHDDMECGGYDFDFSKMPEKLEEIKIFTYEKLGIADFIIPAIYQGLFSKVHIMKNLVPNKLRSERMFVRLVKKSELIKGSYVPFLHHEYLEKEDSPYRFYEEIKGGLLDFPEVKEEMILDIDLDYFCWDDSLKSVPQKKIEITQEAYQEYMGDPYHPFRIVPRRLLDVAQIGGKYYLVYEEHLAQMEYPSEDKMIRRIDRFLNWMAEKKIKPHIITICRSRYSGYLNQRAFPLVEEEFLNRINKILPVKLEQI